MISDEPSRVTQLPSLIAYGSSSKGKVRERNEDNYVCDSRLGIWLVADGVGGNACGDVASRLVADEIPKLLTSGSSHRHAIKQIHEAIKCAPKNGIGVAGMATTLVLAQQIDNKIIISSVGDSRAYLFSKNKLTQLTKDHSLFQRFIDTGIDIKKEILFKRLKNVLTQCIGSLKMESLTPDEKTVQLDFGEKLLLCSDGLYNEVNIFQIQKIIAESLPAKNAVEKLIKLANKNGGSDNITAVLIDAH